MKLLIIGDLHGQMPKIPNRNIVMGTSGTRTPRGMNTTSHFDDFDAILSVGDICDTDFMRKIQFRQIKKKMKDPSYKFSPWYEILGKRKAKQKIDKSLLKARRIMEFLASFNVPVYIVPGNSDLDTEPMSTWDFMKYDFFGGLIWELENVENVHGRTINLGEFRLIGYGYSYGPEFPQEKGDKDFFSREELSSKMKSYQNKLTEMDGLFRKAKKPVIFLSHNVPYNTPIDKIEAKSSPRFGYHYGSLVAREMIDKYKPAVCIAGHMHEHYRKILLGKTTCIAAGFGSNAVTLVETEKGKVKRVRFFKE